MRSEAEDGAESTPVLRTLADKVNWLIDHAHPVGRGPYSLQELSDLIQRATGEEVSYTTIWKLRNGQAQNPQKRVIEALAKTFGVPPAFFFDDYDPRAAGLLHIAGATVLWCATIALQLSLTTTNSPRGIDPYIAQEDLDRGFQGVAPQG